VPKSRTWHVSGWSLRTKVAVVLMLPATVALVLGGIRVQSALSDASRLSAVRDQVGVLGDSVALSDLVIAEMSAALSPSRDGLGTRQAAVDQRASAARQAATFAKVPADVNQILTGALDKLTALRQHASDPITAIAGYLEVINNLGDVGPGIVAAAHTEDLDHTARAATSLLRLRAILATEEALLRFGGTPTVTPAMAAAAQRLTAEESLLVSQVERDVPAGYTARVNAATSSAQARRDALQAAVSETGVAQPESLLPPLTTESTGLDGMRAELVNALADNVSALTNQARSDALRDAAIVLGALLAALAVALIVARSLLSPVRTLRAAALDAAHHKLPEAVERVRAGEPVDWESVEPVPVHTGEEIGQLARAFDDMHRQAVRLAGEQAELRHQISEMFTTLSRRSQSLVQLQLEVIDELEADEQNPKRLDGLFRLDHLATRLRRNGENLQVLAGGSPPRQGQGPVTVVELLRAATSEVNDYRRITLGHAPSGSVHGAAAADIVHIMAELLENSTRFSSPQRKVVLTADRGTEGGLLIEVVDAGLGMAADDLAAVNQRLAGGSEVGPETTRRMGLFVVSRLAERHGVTVRLRPTYDTAKQAGITASVHVPAALMIADRNPETVRIPVVSVPEARDEEPVRSWFVAAVAVDAPAPPKPEPARPAAPARLAMAAPEKVRREAGTPLAPQPTTVAPQPTALTAAGLPQRKPGARVVPVEPEPKPDKADKAERPGFRDADAIRGVLSRHYSGVRAARLRADANSEAKEGQ
jgi:signal transduction histidine kinase